MVRERVGDWTQAWRFALAGLLAAILVIALGSTAITAAPFAGGQDQLFPAPAPDPRSTLVALDQASANNLGGYPLVSNDWHADVISYLLGLNPSVILFDIPLNRLTPSDPENPAEQDTNLQ